MEASEFIKAAEAYGLDLSARFEGASAWSEVLNSAKYAPNSYTPQMIEYIMAYEIGNGREVFDLSVILSHDKKPVAIWPVALTKDHDNLNFGSFGRPLLPPLFADNVPRSVRKRITRGCLDLGIQTCREQGIEGWESSEVLLPFGGLSDWHSESMARGGICSISHELFLDLSPTLPEIKSNLRKSYKSLINVGSREWAVGVMETPVESVWKEFVDLHLHVSGRKTRPDSTWDLQLANIAKKGGVFVYLRDSDGRMVGGGNFYLTRDEALYDCGVYDRSLFDKPLGHVVQFRAIEEFKNRGIKWYRIGRRYYAGDTPVPSPKELAISDFKSGFASHVIPSMNLKLAVCDSSL
jgi:FemAB family protein